MYRPPATETTKEHCCAGCGRPIVDTNKRISIGANSAVIDGVEYRLTPQRCDLLRLLARVIGEAVHSEVIYRQLWGADGDADPHGIKTRISLLRSELSGSPVSITPEFGVGYRLTLQPEAKKNARIKDHRKFGQRIVDQRAAGHRTASARRQAYVSADAERQPATH